MGCWTGRRRALSTPARRSSACSRSRASARLLPNCGGPRRECPRRAACHERLREAEIAERYGPGRTLAEVSQTWRPSHPWAAVHLRARASSAPRDRRPLSHPVRRDTLSDHALNRRAALTAEMLGNLVAQTVGSRHAELDVLRPVIGAA